MGRSVRRPASVRPRRTWGEMISLRTLAPVVQAQIVGGAQAHVTVPDRGDVHVGACAFLSPHCDPLSSAPPSAPAPPASGDGPKDGSSGGSSTDWSIGELLRWTQARFGERGIVDARLDAEHLLAHALGCSRMTLYTEHDRPVDDEPRARFREFVRRRLGREPVAHIEGKRGFHALGLELEVDRRVLVPRPETEHLVDWLLEDLAAIEAPRVVDVGTGSGAIALAVKHARADVDVVAVDVSDDALAVASANAVRLGALVRMLRSDLLDAVQTPTGGWSAIAANLPYIPSAVIETLDPEVRMFEPRLALDGGEDGLVLIRRLLDAVVDRAALAEGGAVYLEVGFDQARAVAAMAEARGLVAAIRNDYAGIGRIVRARSRPVDGPAVPVDAPDA